MSRSLGLFVIPTFDLKYFFQAPPPLCGTPCCHQLVTKYWNLAENRCASFPTLRAKIMRVSNLTDASVRAGKLVDARLTGEGKGNAEAFRQSAPECSSLTFFVSRHAMEKTPSLSSIHQCTCMQLQVLPNRSFWWHL